MYTYIIESQGYYKIGKTSRLIRRLNEYNTHNPLYELIILIIGDYEKYLHKLFSKQWYRDEWFNLDKEDLTSIRKENFVFQTIEDYKKSKNYEDEIKTRRKVAKRYRDKLKKNKEILNESKLPNFIFSTID